MCLDVYGVFVVVECSLFFESGSLVMALYVQSIVSLCLPLLVDGRTLKMGSVLDALDAV